MPEVGGGGPDDVQGSLSPADTYRFVAAMALCLPCVEALQLDTCDADADEVYQQRGKYVLSPLVPLAALTSLRVLGVTLPNVSTAALQADVQAVAALCSLESLTIVMTCLVAPAADAAAGRAGPSDADLTPLSALVRLKVLDIAEHALSRPGEDGSVTFTALPPLLELLLLPLDTFISNSMRTCIERLRCLKQFRAGEVQCRPSPPAAPSWLGQSLQWLVLCRVDATHLLACPPSSLQHLEWTGAPHPDHLRQVLLTPLLPQLHTVFVPLNLDPAPAIGAAAFYGMCLTQRAARGLRPLALWAYHLKRQEAEGLAAELAALAVTGYTIEGRLV